jgi:uncharacterized protein YecT (DUF1311 family)
MPESRLLMNSWIISIVLSLVVASFAVAEGKPAKHPIDVKTEAAEEKALNTAEQTEAQAKGLKLWDAEMNRVYAKLKKRLKPAAFDKLQAAQRDWLKYRDSQQKLLLELYQEFQGTMFIPMHAAAVKEITRSRTLELTHLLEVYEEFAE